MGLTVSWLHCLGLYTFTQPSNQITFDSIYASTLWRHLRTQHSGAHNFMTAWMVKIHHFLLTNICQVIEQTNKMLVVVIDMVIFALA